MAAASAWAIELRKINKRFGPVHANRDIDLKVKRGTIHGIVGENGAGKSTLMSILYGFYTADSGEIRLNGQRVELRSPQDAVAHGVAYVPEDRRRHGVVLEMPIAQNMSMAVHRRIFPGTWLRFGKERRHALDFIRDRVAVTGVADSAIAEAADEVLLLDFADEESVVQTRFPTTLLVLARAALGEDLSALPDQAQELLSRPLDIDIEGLTHFVYLGSGWTYGLAQEAALKIREAAQAWAESYPMLDYRHGPLAVADVRSLVWIFANAEPSLVADIERTGATVRVGTADPLVELVQAQRLAVAIAERSGLNPDAPRHLTRSIVLG